MPYLVKKQGSKWCVFKKGGGKVPGGCHSTKSDAVDHMRALYVNVSDAAAAAASSESESYTVVDPPSLSDAIKAAKGSNMTLEPIKDSPYWALRNVPVCSTGIEYALSTGPHTFTPEDLADAVAALEDPAVVSPRIALGHTDPRFNGDGEPALGRVEGMHLSDDGQTIIGDYEGVPEWLAKIMPVAYPSRSIEGAVNATTVTGKKYGLIITAVKQLGVIWPGVSVLEDIPLLLSAKGPDGVQLQVAASSEERR